MGRSGRELPIYHGHGVLQAGPAPFGRRGSESGAELGDMASQLALEVGSFVLADGFLGSQTVQHSNHLGVEFGSLAPYGSWQPWDFPAGTIRVVESDSARAALPGSLGAQHTGRKRAVAEQFKNLGTGDSPCIHAPSTHQPRTRLNMPGSTARGVSMPGGHRRRFAALLLRGRLSGGSAKGSTPG